jgi:tetratricopeptide (TPR) repeat protein
MNKQSFFWAVTNKAGVKAFQAGAFTEAEGYFTQALAYAQQHFPANDQRIEISLNNLRETQIAQGKITTPHADEICADAVEAFSKGKYREAEVLYLKALEIMSLRGQKIHPVTASIYSALSLIQIWRGRLEYAEKLAWKALEIRVQFVKSDHPEVGTDLHTLASIFHAQQKYCDAESMYRRAISIMQIHFGIEDVQVQTAARNFAAMLADTKPGDCGTQDETSKAMEQFKSLLKAAQSHYQSGEHRQN